MPSTLHAPHRQVCHRMGLLLALRRMTDRTPARTPVHLLLADSDAIWRVHAETLLDYLTNEERDRAAGHYLALDAHRFIARRAVLRVLLARRVGTAPVKVRMIRGRWGKPYVPTIDGIAFSASHSHGMATIALTRGDEVGIDLERIRRGVDLDGLARRYFAASEIDALHELPRAERHRALFDGWTRKEAFVKAIGAGLSYPLDAFTVNLLEAGTVCTRAYDGAYRPSRWSAYPIDVGPNFAGAVVVGPGHRPTAPRTIDPSTLTASQPLP